MRLFFLLTDSSENVTDTYKYFAFGQSLTSSGATTKYYHFDALG